MKIIDSKGRLFSAINIIDFFVIALLLFVVPVFYFTGKVLVKKKVQVQPSEFLEQEMYCNFMKLSPYKVNMITIGDKELDDDGTVAGEILWVGQSRPYQYTIDLGQEQKYIVKDPNLREILVKLRLKTSIVDNNLYYRNKQISYVSSFAFHSGKYSAIAMPVPPGFVDIEKKKEAIELQCNLINVAPETAKLISVGDRELDNKGEVMAELVEIGESKPYQYQVYLGKDEVQTVRDLILKEIPVKLRFKTVLVGNNAYYKNSQIMVNYPFEFKTDRYQVTVVPISNKIQKWVKVKVKFMGLSPELSNIINKGHMEKDNTDKVIGVLSDIVSISPSQISALKVEENKLVFINDPYRTDIVAVLDLLCFEKEGALYFKNSPIKIGSQIIFSSDIYLLPGSIIDIIDHKK